MTDVIPGSIHDRSISGFRIRHGSGRGPMSRATYYRLKRDGRGPRETHVTGRTIIITARDEVAWEDARANPVGTEAMLVARMKAVRLKRAKKAARAATLSPNHVSKQRRRKQ